MKCKRKQNWKMGDIFFVKIKDGTTVVAQIVGQEKEALNSVSCAFFDWRVKSDFEIECISEMPLSKIFSILFVTRDLLDNGIWRIVANRPINLSRNLLPYENLRQNGWIGAKIHGSGIVNEFLNAFYGLVPWNNWKDPNYLDKLLLYSEKKPKNLILK